MWIYSVRLLLSELPPVKDVLAHCYCVSLVRTLFIRHALPRHVFPARAPSRNSTQYSADDLCVNLVCEHSAWMLGDPHFFFGRTLPFLILSFILKTKRICTWEVLIISHYTIHIRSNLYMNTGLCDLGTAFFKSNFTWFNHLCSKDLSNRPIYAVLNTHNLDMIIPLKYIPIVINPARIASGDRKSQKCYGLWCALSSKWIRWPQIFLRFNIILWLSTYSQSFQKNLYVGTFGRERP